MPENPKDTRSYSVIPAERLSREALLGLCEEFASRDGTDYGDVEKTLEEKTREVERMVASGEASIVFDDEGESVTILMTRDL